MGRTWVDAFSPERLRQTRERAGLTQRELAVKVLEADLAGKGTDPTTLPGERWARIVETSRGQVVTYEGGTHTPRAPMLRRLAVALGVDVFDLLRTDTPRNLAMLRTRLGLTQANVAAELRTAGRAYYGRVELGIAPLHDEHDQRRLADLLQVDPEELRPLLSGGRTPA